VLGVLRCTDGDPACDLDGAADGTCTFGVALCVANHDPRLAKCQPSGMTSFEVMAPDADRTQSSMDRANAIALEQGLGGLGLEIRRRGRVLSTGTSSGDGPCSPLVRLRTLAPTAPGRKPVRRRFRLRGVAGRHTDTDRFTLECRR
jgi:hypothetical protein